MLKRFAAALFVLPLIAIGISAQGLDTRASKDDWEEVNFEFNSTVLVDGFPSLLRLSELLQKNPGYKVKLEGHTDKLGSDSYNDKLGMGRANMVRDFLVKYGARSSQIDVMTRGKADPKYAGQKSTYSKTDEARWMNRRVVVTVMDDQGRTVSAAGIGDAIRAIEPPKPIQAAGMTDCCSEVLRRLDKLDDIAKMLKDLADQNAALRRELDGLKAGQQAIEAKVNQLPTAGAQPGAGQNAAGQGGSSSGLSPQATSDVAAAVAKELDQRRKDSRFQLLGINAGPDGRGDLTFSGKGRFFAPFGDHYAFQAQGEYLYFRNQKEGQFDFGLVDRIGRFQAGLFSSFKHVSLSGNQNGGTLGQASLTMDYIFKWGKVGVFGSKGFLDNALINSQSAVLSNGVVSPDLLEQRYLSIVDQAGGAGSVGLWGKNYLEGNAGFLKSRAAGDRFGGTLRFVFPVTNKIAITVEGGINETLVGQGNNGRAVVGVQFGNVTRPKEFLATEHAIPVDVPRVRYDILTRTVQNGHAPPVADAGPDQIGVAAGTIQLNGSNSYSPDGLPLTFQWTLETTPAVSLSSPTSAITTFQAAASQAYSFRLVVKDSQGGQAAARVRVTTQAPAVAQILFFTANPTVIDLGKSSTLAWAVTGADTVSISSIGNVSPNGSAPVSPTVTTTYTLTATAGGKPTTATATVTVNTPQTKLLFCYATPTNIIAGESATLFYQSQNATSVTITPGIGSVGLGGSIPVSPTTTTTYVVTATGPSGSGTDSCNIAVTVTAAQLPRIILFSANPATITAGQSSTLTWTVENATSVSITSLGTVALNGTQAVTPAATTVYTLTASNATGSVTAQATVTVNPVVVTPPPPPPPPAPVITSFTANPPTSPAPGSPVILTCTATNATSINLIGAVFPGPTAATTVNPAQTTTYMCTATGQNNQTATATVTVTVTQPTPPPPPVPVPVPVISGGNIIYTLDSDIIIDASGSFSPSGNTPLTYLWTSVSGGGSILTPTSSKPRVQMPTVGFNYVFNVRVTDSKGNFADGIVTVVKPAGQPR